MLAVGAGGGDAAVVQASGAGDHAHARALQAPADVRRLCSSQLLDAVVDHGDVDAHVLPTRRVRRVPHTERGRSVDLRHDLAGGDQGLGRHAVGQHGGTADAVGVDHGDVGVELGSDERRLVPAGTTAHDDDLGALTAAETAHPTSVSADA